MFILKTTQTYLPYLRFGGPPVKVSGIARELARRGHQVTVLTADWGELNGDSPIAGWQRERDQWGWHAKHDGVDAIYLPTLVNYRATSINPRARSFCTKRLADFNLVHIYGLYDTIGAVVARACRRRNVPYVLEPLGMFGAKIRSQRKKQIYTSLVGKNLFAGAAKIIATSKTEKRELIEGGVPGEKIYVRPNGTDLTQFRDLPQSGSFRAQLGVNDETPLVLFLGRISFIKGLDLLVEAFAGLSQKAVLVLAGPDDGDGCLAQIRARIEELRLSERILVSPPLYGQKKLAAFADADMFVLPSRYESFGNSAAEAVASGTPVLLTHECGIASVIDGRAGLAVACETGALREGLEKLLSDYGLRQSLASNAQALAVDLSWEQPVTEMERVYRELSSSG